MQYDKEILRVLAEAGDEGLSVQNISRHVFNACNSFFNPIDQDEVRRYVQSYLLKNSKTANALLAKNKKGVINSMLIINYLSSYFSNSMMNQKFIKRNPL